MLGKNTKVGATVGAAATGIAFIVGGVWVGAREFNEIHQKFAALEISFNVRIAEQRGHHEDRFTKQDAVIVALREELTLRRAGVLQPEDGVEWPIP